jgi:hypothetical protein
MALSVSNLVEIVHDEAIVVAPLGGINVPSNDGMILGHGAFGLQLYLRGGQTDGGVPRRVVAVLQASNDLEVGGIRQWTTIAGGYDEESDDNASAWTSTGLVVRIPAISIETFPFYRFRVNYTFDGPPGAINPGIVVCVVDLEG